MPISAMRLAMRSATLRTAAAECFGLTPFIEQHADGGKSRDLLRGKVHHLNGCFPGHLIPPMSQVELELKPISSNQLTQATRQQFQEASARYLETLANRVDCQRAQERGLETMTRAEIEAIAGPNADRLIARAQQIRDQEMREAAVSERLADRAVETERRQEGRAGDDPDAARELRAERIVAAGAERVAATEGRQAVAASEAVRRLSAHPGQPLPENLARSDALAKLRAEQERLVEEFEVERLGAEASKPQRMS